MTKTPRRFLTSWPCRRRRSVSPGRSPPHLWCSSPPASAEPCARAGSSGRACSRRRWPYSTVWQRKKPKHTVRRLAPHQQSQQQQQLGEIFLPSRHCQSSPGQSTCTHRQTLAAFSMTVFFFSCHQSTICKFTLNIMKAIN